MSEPSAEVARIVRLRACDRCEFCRMHQSLHVPTFHIEHVVPSCAGGSSTPENLALACPACNLHKANRLQVPDPDSQAFVSLFHPRRQQWAEHFQWSGFLVIGLTAVGRATIEALHLNHPRRIKMRMAEAVFDLFPPDAS